MQYWIGDDGNNTKSAPWYQQGRQWAMYGEGGDDELTSGQANDYLYGGTGNDRLRGLWGDDELYGEDGNDNLDGSDGDDFLDGGTGHDELRGGWGRDQLYGDLGDDILQGNDGEDSLYGGADNDKLNGGWQGDTLDGQDGNDILEGDSLGGKGDDTLLGGMGNDILVGGAGTNSFTGGSGADRFVFTPSSKFLDLAQVAVSSITTNFDTPIIESLGAAVNDVLEDLQESHDTITDFTPYQDKIDLSAFDFSFGSTTNALNIQTVGGDILITFSESGNSVTLQGVTGITFIPDYFIV